MTALGGYWSLDGRDAASSCARIVAAQTLYGPDGSAIGGAGEIALGRCLSLDLPEDVHDRGVQSGGGGRYTLVADVRIDNRAELVAALGLEPSAAAGACDAALVLAAIERWGEEAIPRLIGDFALILWDAEQKCLILARDFIGARPLHFARGQGFVAVASMPKGLHALHEIPRAPREDALVAFLANTDGAGSSTFYADVERVEPGCIVRISGSRIQSRRYWPGRIAPVRFARDADYAGALAAQLDRATAARLRRYDGGVGTHLSAGLDSSAVTTSAARLLGDTPLTAYTAVPLTGTPEHPTRLVDEGPIAAAVAALHGNIDHRLIRTDDTGLLDGLDRAVQLFDMPVRDLVNLVWTSAICADAKARGIGVMLTGQMGNLTISYDGTPHLASLFRQGRVLALAKAARGLQREGMRRRGVAVAAVAPYLPRRLWRAVERAAGRELPLASYAALNPALLARAPRVPLELQPERNGVERRITSLLQNDLGNAYKGLLGGYGVDMRDPTADRRLVEFCLGIPEAQFILSGETRSLARRAFAGRLPEVLLRERRRGLQGADWPVTLSRAKADVVDQVERLARTPAAQFLDTGRLRTLAASVPDGAATTESEMVAYRVALLRAISAGHFARKASGSNH